MEHDDFAVSTTNQNQMERAVQAEGVIARQTQEVQAMMVIAKRFPRDEVSAHSKIVKACQRPGLAEAAIYQYPRGGTRIEGPSIRLAEAIATAWGNLDFGMIELEQRAGESVCMAYAWDMETNTRKTNTFTVKHVRKSGNNYNKLEDPRDVYEMVANQSSRRLRQCILQIIPGDVVDDAVEQCNKTLAGDSKEPIIDRVKKMIVAFADLGVTQDMIERRMGYKVEAANERDVVKLRKIYVSIKDGVGSREDWFEITKEKPKTALDEKFEKDDDGVIAPADRTGETNSKPESTETAPPEKELCGHDSGDGRLCDRDGGHGGKHHYPKKDEDPPVKTPPSETPASDTGATGGPPVEEPKKNGIPLGDIPKSKANPDDDIEF